MKQELVLWEPLIENPFCNLNNQLHFYDMSYGYDFTLAFEEAKNSELFIFNYRGTPDNTDIIAFQFHPTLIRSDLHELINQVMEEHQTQYEPSFFKMNYSNWISWYDKVFPARVQLNPKIEHQIFLTSDFIVELLTETTPDVSIIKKEEWGKFRNSLKEHVND